MKKILIVLCLLILCGCAKSSDDPFVYVSENEGNATSEYSNGLYYSQLSDNEKNLYNNILAGVGSFYTSINCYGVNVDELSRTVYAFNNEHPEYFFVSLDLGYVTSDGYVSRIDFNYEPIDDVSIKDTYDYIDGYCNDVLATMADTSGKDRIKAIHDYICENTTYNIDVPYDQDIRSIVYNGQSVCTGYVKLFQLLAIKSGFNCYEVEGIAFNDETSERHAFNLIEYKGNFYWVDCTLDDMEDGYDYKYFMVKDEQLLADHEILDTLSFIIPEIN